MRPQHRSRRPSWKTGGVDNVTDQRYAERVSRAGADIPGFNQLTRVNEAGRTLWMKAQYTF